MANHTPLASWLYSKRTQLNARFREFNWPSRIFPGVFDFETTISWKGIEANGRGVDSSREIALEKSVAEAIERLICLTLGFDSVGFAIAGTHDPSQHAKNECLERFFLNEHLKNGTSLYNATVDFPEAEKLKILAPTAEVSFYRMNTPKNLFGISCRIHLADSKKTSLGFALSETLDHAARRSFFEALPSFAWLASDEKLELNELPWHLKTEFIEKLESLFAEDDRLKADQMKSPSLSSIELDLTSLPIFEGAPIQTARYQIASLE
ncbi:MAG: hypothetical protein BroJett040_06290 [Oligoflexia bacterium]|nr:MAG: hypothetical protein BroJett040_06290 [Oligoflexia bacterium]